MHGRKVMSLYWKYIESHKNFLVKKNIMLDNKLLEIKKMLTALIKKIAN